MKKAGEMDSELSAAETELPFISIIIPVYNRSEQIARLLRTLVQQQYARRKFEIIVVDDGSTDATAAVARHCLEDAAKQDTSAVVAYTIITKTNGGPASARNCGAAAAQGEILAFIDSDCLASPEWLRSLADVFAQHTCAGVGAAIINQGVGTWTANYLVHSNFYRHRVKNGVVEYLITINAAFRKIDFERIHGFHEFADVWNEDADLSFKIRSSGASLAVTDSSQVIHTGVPSTVSALAAELRRYGYGAAILAKNWSGRSPVKELIRHAGACVLAPYVAAKLLPGAPLAEKIGSIPLIIVEHASFCVGLLQGMFHSSRHTGAKSAE